MAQLPQVSSGGDTAAAPCLLLKEQLILSVFHVISGIFTIDFKSG